ncbi:uncharacterized protein LOC141693885 isoform X1 [Apium graveolens]|uniref:uncharacterized protein LOC141693885 isoform X1 n=2 Tax=Apium graveolens TaxID=4045 RepID=UPI003D7BD626
MSQERIVHQIDFPNNFVCFLIIDLLLQKYRIAMYVPESAEGKSERQTSMSDTEQIGTKTGMYLKEALQMQLDVQRRLHEQLEIERQLQLRIEEKGKQLKQIFDLQQHKTTSVFESQKSSTEPPPPDEPLITRSNDNLQRSVEEHQIAKSTLDSEEGNPEKQTGESDVEESETKSGLYLKESLQMQLDIQRRLHEELENQRTLQLRIEEQGRALKQMYDLQKQNRIE